MDFNYITSNRHAWGIVPGRNEHDMECIFCGTEIEDGFCVECSDTADDMGLDYMELVNII